MMKLLKRVMLPAGRCHGEFIQHIQRCADSPRCLRMVKPNSLNYTGGNRWPLAFAQMFTWQYLDVFCALSLRAGWRD